MTEIEKILDKAHSERLYGKVEIEFRNGAPTIARVTITKPLDTERENRNELYHNRV